MPTEDDLTTRLIFESIGQPAIDEASRALEANKAAIQALQTAMTASGTPTAQMTDQLQKLAAVHIDLSQKIDVMQNQAKRGGSALDTVSTSSTRAAQALLQLGYLADDAQYGLRGIQNNIPQLAMLIGGPTGTALAGAAGIAVTALALVINHLDKFKEILGLSGTEAEAERMERLAKATNRTATETAQLNEYKKKQAEIEQLAGLKGEAEKEATAAFQKAIGEIDFGKLTKGVAAARLTEAGGEEAVMARDEELQRKIDQIKFAAARVGPALQPLYEKVFGTVGDQVQKAQEEALAKYTAQAEEDVRAAGHDPARMASLMNLIRRQAQFFPKAAAEQLAETTPEGIAAEAEFNRQQEKFAALGPALQKKRQAAKKARDEQIDALNEQAKLGEEESKRTAPELWKTPEQQAKAAAAQAKQDEIDNLMMQAMALPVPGGVGPGMAQTIAEHAYKAIHDFDKDVTIALVEGADKAMKEAGEPEVAAERGAEAAQRQAERAQKTARQQRFAVAFMQEGATEEQAAILTRKTEAKLALDNTLTEMQAGWLSIQELKAEIQRAQQQAMRLVQGVAGGPQPQPPMGGVRRVGRRGNVPVGPIAQMGGFRSVAPTAPSTNGAANGYAGPPAVRGPAGDAGALALMAQSGLPAMRAAHGAAAGVAQALAQMAPVVAKMRWELDNLTKSFNTIKDGVRVYRGHFHR